MYFANVIKSDKVLKWIKKIYWRHGDVWNKLKVSFLINTVSGPVTVVDR